VFNGHQGSPYRPEQARDPLGVYGATKAAGEEAVEQLLGVAAGGKGSGHGVILRTSWVIGPVGKNFARTMVRLHREKSEIGVVDVTPFIGPALMRVCGRSHAAAPC